MYSELYTITSGMILRRAQMEQLAYNLANADTVGFKMETLASSEAYIRSSEGTYTTPSQVSIKGQQIDLSQGPIRHTGRAMDMALDGNGFFVVKTAAGPRLTRDGRFSLNGESLLTLNGLPVMGKSGVIKITPGELVVDETGQIKIDGKTVDTLDIVEARDPSRLKKEGSGLFAAEPQSDWIPASSFKVMQGHLEMSNVEPVSLMVRLIDVLRNFEMQQKMLQHVDQLNQKAIETLPRRM